MIRAAGRYPGGTNCEWELHLDPTAAYLVRQARCRKAGSDFVIADISNEGIVTFGDAIFAESGRFAFAPGRRGGSADAAFEVKMTDYLPKPDHDLINDVRSLLTEPFPRSTDVIDYRTNPLMPVKYTVGEAPVGEVELNDLLNESINSITAPDPASPAAAAASVPAPAAEAGGGWDNRPVPVAVAQGAWVPAIGLLLIVLGAFFVAIFWWRRRRAQ